MDKTTSVPYLYCAKIPTLNFILVSEGKTFNFPIVNM